MGEGDKSSISASSRI